MKRTSYESQWIPRNIVAQTKRLDLLTYLERYDPNELVCISNGVYSTRTHDSLKISNGKWCWWSRGIGGRSALDYLIKVRGMGFQEAVLHIADCIGKAPDLPPPVSPGIINQKSPLPFSLPPKNQDNNRVLSYLTGRGISLHLVQACIRTGKLYEDTRHNCVFVGFDEKGAPRHGFIRSSDPHSTFLRDADGSDKRYSFCIEMKEAADSLHLYESAIDLLSYLTLAEMDSRDWRSAAYLVLSGIYTPAKDNRELPLALKEYLRTHPDIKSIILCLDNDRSGRLAAEAIRERLPVSYDIQTDFPAGKDYNAQLMERKGLHGIRTRAAKQPNLEQQSR